MLRILSLLVLSSVLSFALSYYSIHQSSDAYNKRGFIAQAEKMLELSKTDFPGQYSTSTYKFYLSENLHATKKLSTHKMCTNEDFSHFKLYIPVGTQYVALSFGGLGNPGYVIHYAYNPVEINHANALPEWLGENKEQIFVADITGYIASRDGTRSIVTPKESPFMESGGWLYIDVIRGNEFSPSNRDSGNLASQYLVKLTVDLKIDTQSGFAAWLKRAKEDFAKKSYQIIKPNGDPYDTYSPIKLIYNSCQSGTVSQSMSVPIIAKNKGAFVPAKSLTN
jgi:hypothetical protein